MHCRVPDTKKAFHEPLENNGSDRVKRVVANSVRNHSFHLYGVKLCVFKPRFLLPASQKHIISLRISEKSGCVLCSQPRLSLCLMASLAVAHGHVFHGSQPRFFVCLMDPLAVAHMDMDCFLTHTTTAGSTSCMLTANTSMLGTCISLI